ncbi:hypothetical protein FDUTEX481_03030 [Tolypothrix sp. PCC 7601]|nr:hypothetical protein FDUTEX481_03030 [Tolypothrix sp. PCC 7601]
MVFKNNQLSCSSKGERGQRVRVKGKTFNLLPKFKQYSWIYL